MVDKVMQHAIIKDVNEKERSFIVEASNSIVDRDGEVINVEGWDLEKYRKNPVVLFVHDHRDFPIGRAAWVKKQDDRLIAKIILHDKTEKARIAWELVRDGFLNAVSVGFLPRSSHLEKVDGKEVRIYEEVELLEISLVPVPANPDALVIERYVKSVKERDEVLGREIEKFFDEVFKNTVPPHGTPIDMESSWDKNEAIQALRRWASSDGSGNPDTIDWKKYARGFAWFDSENSETFGAYKLPHHTVRNDELVAVWKGVAAAMAALLGAMGGVDLPDGDRRKVYDHLARHYRDAGKEPPEFREYTEEELKALFPEIYETEVEKRLKNIEKQLEDVRDLLGSLNLSIVELQSKIPELSGVVRKDLAGESRDEGVDIEELLQELAEDVKIGR